MEICIFSDPHRGATYDDQVRFVQSVEECGFTGFFRADHYQAMGGHGLPGPTDAWLTLGALARETSRIRLGSLVSPVTFRLPGPLAIAVAQADQMSGGRVELGLGAGWYEKEHTSYGLPFPPLKDRFEMLAEQLQIITGLWSTAEGETFTFRGLHYQLIDSPALPKPVQQPAPPIIVGGRGARRLPELAARYADEFNASFMSLADAAIQYRRVMEAAERVNRAAVGRRSLVLSNGFVVACGRNEREAQARAAAFARPGGVQPQDPVIGVPGQVVERIGALASIGVARIYLRLVDMTDLDHLELIASEVLPQV